MEAFSNRVDPSRIHPMIFLTDFFGGMWLHISHGPSLLWARIGGVVLYSLNAVIIYSILSSYFPRRRTFVTVLICSLLITMRPGINIIDYYTFPAFLLNMMVWFLHKRLQAPSGTNRAHLYEFFFGFLAVPVVLSRMSLVLLVLWPVVMIPYYLMTRRHVLGPARMVALPLLGCACACIVFGLLYWRVGLLEGGGLNLLSGAIDLETHNPRRLLSVYWSQALIMAEMTGYVVFGIYILSRIGRNISRNLSNILIVILPIAFGFYVLMQDWNMDRIAYSVIMASAGCVIVFLLLIIMVGNEHDDRIVCLAIASLIIVVVSPLGSASGLKKIFNGMWLALPLTVLCAEEMHGRIRNDHISAMLSHNNAVIVLMFVLALVFQFTNIYRDDGNRFHLTQSFSHPCLAYIYSTPGRVRVVDELITAIQQYTEENDEILLASSLPLFHYLTNTKATLKPWNFIGSLNDIKRRQQRIIEEDRLPKLFIYAKVDTRGERNWPYTTVDCYKIDREKLEFLKDEYIRRLKYELLWENMAFAVYGIPSCKTGIRYSRAP
jgi:hypothetical protein